jgi:hypothetical protein
LQVGGTEPAQAIAWQLLGLLQQIVRHVPEAELQPVDLAVLAAGRPAAQQLALAGADHAHRRALL